MVRELSHRHHSESPAFTWSPPMILKSEQKRDVRENEEEDGYRGSLEKRVSGRREGSRV